VVDLSNFFVWDAVSQSTKWRDLLKMWGNGPLAPPGYAYVCFYTENDAMFLPWCQ